jgi:hypothetical protein
MPGDKPFWAGTPEEGAVMYVLATEVPKIIGPVVEAALSPLLARVDRALDVASRLAGTVEELVAVAKVLLARADGVSAQLSKLLRKPD